MDIKHACECLELSIDDLYKLTKSDIKKHYYRMALKSHPDKNGNTIESTDHFQKINRAYEYLLNEIVLIDDNDNDSNNNNDNYDDNDYSQNTDTNINTSDYLSSSSVYINILSICISNILRYDYNYNIFINQFVKDLLVIGSKLTNEKVFELFHNINKNQTLEIYSFLCKYKDILYVSPYILELVSLVIKEKYKDDLIFILTPSIDDLLDNNLYKLVVNNNTYLVPLWHTELYFDYNDPVTKTNVDEKEIIVFCNPLLSEEITIEDSNIYYNLLVVFDKKTLLDNPFIELNIGRHLFKIPTCELKVQHFQYYTLKNKGISKINENDMYNVSYRGDIIVKITFQ